MSLRLGIATAALSLGFAGALAGEEGEKQFGVPPLPLPVVELKELAARSTSFAPPAQVRLPGRLIWRCACGGRFGFVSHEFARSDRLLPVDALPVLSEAYRRASHATVVRMWEGEAVVGWEKMAREPWSGRDAGAIAGSVAETDELRRLYLAVAAVLDAELDEVEFYGGEAEATAEAFLRRTRLVPTLVIEFGEPGRFRVECDLRAGVAIVQAGAQWSAYAITPRAATELAMASSAAH